MNAFPLHTFTHSYLHTSLSRHLLIDALAERQTQAGRDVARCELLTHVNAIKTHVRLTHDLLFIGWRMDRDIIEALKHVEAIEDELRRI